ncbi:MAG: alpha/beta hydrolase [Nocardioides sp.]|uniref:alpha/beta hydrolase n=1 Tax=Nocardioides sp. TaxID=35761 RepID=UPI003EFFD40C
MLFPESVEALKVHALQLHVTDPAYSVEAERAAARTAALGAPREHVEKVLDVDAGGVPCRLYVPVDAEPGLVVHLHGGGFVFNDVEVHDPSCRRVANRGRRAVLSVDYRRPPEHRFPAAPDDVDTVLAWLDREAVAHGLEGPLFVHGDSAGANLALVAALRHPGRFAAVALIYPFLDPTGGFDSYRTAADGFDAAEAAWYWEQYAATEADLVDPDLAPLLSTELGTLPPTLVVTCEHDPLRDEGEHLANRLAELGVEVVATRYLGQLHGIWRHPDAFPSAEPMLRQVVGFLAAHVD